MTRPTNPLLAPLLVTSTVVTVALVWFGLRNLQQQSAVERQQTRERLENGADAIAGRIRGRLAEAGERLTAWVATNSSAAAPGVDGAVVVAASDTDIHVTPRGGLPFVPGEVATAPGNQVFAQAEAAEFGRNELPEAAAAYRKISGDPDPRIRAEALLRLGRVLLKTRDLEAANAAYIALSKLGDVRIGGLPAGLVSLDGQRMTRAAAGDHAGEQQFASQIARGIDSGRWLLSRSSAEFYRDLWPREPKPDCWLLAEAMAGLWETEVKPGSSTGGLKLIGVGEKRVLAIWRANGGRSAALVSFPESFIGQTETAGFAYELADAAGRRIAGSASVPSVNVARVIGDPQNPWMMRIWQDRNPPKGNGRGGQFLAAMLAVVILFLWATVYFMARAIRREARVARLQSDFVAAVSHEFRSPLTTVRQLAEMLEIDRVPSEQRRREYYRVLAQEARRLQRLIETLLNFGKMEAGAQQYRFGRVDVRDLVDRAVRETCGEETLRSDRMLIDGPKEAPIQVIGDADALTLAVRNLVDNGLKYSPARERVEVGWSRADGRVSISVADHGPGIPREEQRAVFEKFVRGRAAIEASVKGTGVGLAMVKHVLEAHGGIIQLDSEPGRGSTFTIVLAEAT